MKMYIPEIGDIIKLNNDWKIKLYNETRNSSIYKEFFNEELKKYIPYTEQSKFKEWLIKKDSILIIDRIYIRKGSSDFSSISFKLKHNKKTLRFWAKLNDVNRIDFEIVYINNANDIFNELLELIKNDTIKLSNIFNKIEKNGIYNFDIIYDKNKLSIKLEKVSSLNLNNFYNIDFEYKYVDFNGENKILKKHFNSYTDSILIDKAIKLYNKF